MKQYMYIIAKPLFVIININKDAPLLFFFAKTHLKTPNITVYSTRRSPITTRIYGLWKITSSALQNVYQISSIHTQNLTSETVSMASTVMTNR